MNLYMDKKIEELENKIKERNVEIFNQLARIYYITRDKEAYHNTLIGALAAIYTIEKNK